MKVSVVVPAYDSESYIENCLDSIYDQTYFEKNDFEVIVAVDWCEETLKKIKEIKYKYEPELTVLCLSKNRGTYIALNTAIKKATGETIVVFGSDDVMNKDMVERIMDSYDGVDVVRFKYDNIKEGKNTGTIKYFSYGAISFKKYVWRVLNGFSDWRVAGDSEFVARAEKIFNEKLLDESLFLRNVHGKNMTVCERYGAGSKYRSEKIEEIKKIKAGNKYKNQRVITERCSELKKEKIVATVGVPLYCMKDIAHIAFEGLESQKTGFCWELIILQEKEGRYDFSKHTVGLKKAGCVKIEEILFDKKTSIGEKAFILSRKAKGEVIIIQDGDDRSHEKRLSNSLNAVRSGYDFYNEKRGYFYSFTSGKTIEFIHNPEKHLTGLNKAYSSKIFKKLPESFKIVEKHIDRNLFSCLKPEKIFQNEDIHKDGYFSDGFNKISKREQYYQNPVPPFYKTDFKLVARKECQRSNELKTYVINRSIDTRRLTLFKEECSKMDFSSTIVEPEEISGKIVRSIIDSMKKSISITTAKEISNRTTFGGILSNAVDDRIIIFEDDVVFEPEAKEILKQALNELPENFGVCFLGCYIRSNGKAERYSEHLVKLDKNDKPRIWGAHAIVFNKIIYKELSEKLLSVDSDITDLEISKSIVPKYDSYIVYPMIAFQNKTSMIHSVNGSIHSGINLDELEQSSKMNLNLMLERGRK